MSHRHKCVQPRGLVNQGNWCYMHAVSLCMLFGGGGGCGPEVRSTRATGVTCMLYPYVCYWGGGGGGAAQRSGQPGQLVLRACCILMCVIGGGGGGGGEMQPRGPVNQGNWCYMHAVSLCVLLGGGGGGVR